MAARCGVSPLPSSSNTKYIDNCALGSLPSPQVPIASSQSATHLFRQPYQRYYCSDISDSNCFDIEKFELVDSNIVKKSDLLQSNSQAVTQKPASEVHTFLGASKRKYPAFNQKPDCGIGLANFAELVELASLIRANSLEADNVSSGDYSNRSSNGNPSLRQQLVDSGQQEVVLPPPAREQRYSSRQRRWTESSITQLEQQLYNYNKSNCFNNNNCSQKHYNSPNFDKRHRDVLCDFCFCPRQSSTRVANTVNGNFCRCTFSYTQGNLEQPNTSIGIAPKDQSRSRVVAPTSDLLPKKSLAPKTNLDNLSGSVTCSKLKHSFSVGEHNPGSSAASEDYSKPSSIQQPLPSGELLSNSDFFNYVQRTDEFRVPPPLSANKWNYKQKLPNYSSVPFSILSNNNCVKKYQEEQQHSVSDRGQAIRHHSRPAPPTLPPYTYPCSLSGSNPGEPVLSDSYFKCNSQTSYCYGSDTNPSDECHQRPLGSESSHPLLPFIYCKCVLCTPLYIPPTAVYHPAAKPNLQQQFLNNMVVAPNRRIGSQSNSLLNGDALVNQPPPPHLDYQTKLKKSLASTVRFSNSKFVDAKQQVIEDSCKNNTSSINNNNELYLYAEDNSTSNKKKSNNRKKKKYNNGIQKTKDESVTLLETAEITPRQATIIETEKQLNRKNRKTASVVEMTNSICNSLFKFNDSERGGQTRKGERSAPSLTTNNRRSHARHNHPCYNAEHQRIPCAPVTSTNSGARPLPPSFSGFPISHPSLDSTTQHPLPPPANSTKQSIQETPKELRAVKDFLEKTLFSSLHSTTVARFVTLLFIIPTSLGELNS